MAINPETQYPGKITPASANYPYGEARNITLPGDGTGTPWEAALLNDIFGFQQSLLSESGVVPSGTPDKVGVSQYLESLFKVSGLVKEDYSALRLVESDQLSDKTQCFITDGGTGGAFRLDKTDTVSTDNGITIIVDADGGRWFRMYSGFLNVLWAGAKGDGTTDDSAAITNANNIAVAGGGTLFFPKTSTSYRCKELRILQNGTTWFGEGGRVRLLYNGTGADNGTVIRADKTLDHSSQNYNHVVLDGFKIDGNDLALYGFKANGFTRNCVLRNVDITQCVCPLWVDDGFYSAYENCEFRETPPSMPVGMTVALYDAALFGVHLDVCHIASFRNVKITQVGGNVSNPYTAALLVNNSNGVTFDAGCTWEEMDQASHNRYITDIISIQANATLSIESCYIENLQAINSVFKVAANTSLLLNNAFVYIIKAASLFNATPSSPITINNILAAGLDISDRLFKSISGSLLYKVTLTGNTTFAAGASSGGIYNPSTTTNSKYGLWTDGIVSHGTNDGGEDGYAINGYAVTIDGDFIKVGEGTRVINGQVVNFSMDNNVSQRLIPDLTTTASWNVKISPLGSPYIEIQGSEESGSTYAPTVATFATTGGTNAPSSLVAVVSDFEFVQGGQLRFPSTPKPSSQTNVLDAYKEGVWAPKISDTTGNLAGSTAVCKYIKIGRLVFCSGTITITSLSGMLAEQVYMTDLPFTSQDDGSAQAGLNIGYAENLAITAGSKVSGYVVQNDTRIILNEWRLTSGSAAFKTANLTATTNMRFSFSYLAKD